MFDIRKILLLSLLTFFLAFPSISDAGEKEQTLTLEQAIDRATTFSVDIKNYKTEINKQEYLVDRSSDAVTYTPIDESYNPKDGIALSTHMQNQFNLRKAEKQLENAKRQIIIDVKTAYYAVIMAQNDLEVGKLNYELSQITMLQAESKYKVGLINNADLLTAQAKVASNKATVVDSENQLDNAYAALNKLINFNLTDRLQLTDKISLERVDFDPESKANIAAEGSYETWTAEEAARIADRVKIFATYSNIGKEDANQAQETAKDTKELIRKQTRTMVIGLDTLESKYQELLKKQVELEEKLKVAKVQQSVGMTTRDVVLAADLGLKQTQAGLLQVASQYNTTVDTIKKLTGELTVKSNVIKATY